MNIRKTLLVLAALLWPLAAAAAPDETLTVQAEAGRPMEVAVWRPAAVKGVVLFSHGGGATPTAYQRLADSLTGAGYLVLAPVHLDSLAHPKRSDLKNAFGPRLADLAALSRLAEERAPGKPMAVVGHSYGSLFGLMSAGALSKVAPARDPRVKAVVAFSSPGVIPGLVYPGAYAEVAAPVLTITGDADLVPGFVTRWSDHLTPFETSAPGGKYALVFTGGRHDLVGGAGADAEAFATASQLMVLFLDAHVLGDAGAKGRLQAWSAPAGVELRRR